METQQANNPILKDIAIECDRWQLIGKINNLQSIRIDLMTDLSNEGYDEQEKEVIRKDTLRGVLDYIDETLVNNLLLSRQYE